MPTPARHWLDELSQFLATMPTREQILHYPHQNKYSSAPVTCSRGRTTELF